MSLARVGNQIELHVTDNGRGFDPSGARTRGLGMLTSKSAFTLPTGRSRSRRDSAEAPG